MPTIFRSAISLRQRAPTFRLWYFSFQTYQATLDAIVDIPEHLEEEKLSINLIGESCVPEVAITQPAHGKRETAHLYFRRTLLGEISSEEFALENVGFVQAKIILEIDRDENSVFAFSASSDSRRFLQLLDSVCDNGSPIRPVFPSILCF